MQKRFIFFVLLLYMSGQQMFGVPAIPTPVKVKQPDGTEITVYLKGDEKVHWMETLDGYSLMYDNNKNIVYAMTDANGNMVPSGIKAGTPFLRSAAEENLLLNTSKKLRYSKSQVEGLLQIWDMTSSIQKAPSTITGNKKALCVLMSFQDEAMVKTVQDFENLMNQQGYSANNARGSVKDFYLENSYGQMDLTVTVVGPYISAHPKAYYGRGTSGTAAAKLLAEEAARAADVAVNYAEFANANNQLETFHIIFAGHGMEAGGGNDCIWSHKWSLNTPITLDGIAISTYSCSPELGGASGSNLTNIGVICHELCHVFGAPDYYDTDDSASGGDYEGTGKWDLMAGGNWNGVGGSNSSGNSPAHISMFQKIAFGWVTPTTLSSYTEVNGFKNAAQNAEAYIYTTTTANEYFVLENRQQVGFDAGLPGHGMIIYHIHAVAGANYRNMTNAGHPQQVYPVCASSVYKVPNTSPASYGNINSGGCPFPGTSGKTAFTDFTSPSSLSWAGNNTGKSIIDIREENREISFSFMKPIPSVTNVQTSVTGKDVTVTWTPVEDETLTGYRIYRDDQTIIAVSDPDASSYTQYGVNPGTYDYCVTAMYEQTESDRECAAPTTIGGTGSTCSPVKNLTSKAKGSQVVLDWEPAFNGGWITHAEGSPSTYTGYGYLNYTFAVTWTVEDLKNIYGYTLEKISFYPYYDASECTYTLQIYSGDKGKYPDTKLLEQPITTLNKQKLTEVALTTPIKLDDTTKDLWVLIAISTTENPNYPIARDSGPRVSGRNFRKINGTWSESTLTGNWWISAYFGVSGSGSPVILQSNQVVKEENLAPQNRSDIADISVIEENSIMIQQSGNNQLRASTAFVSGYKVYRDGVYVATVTGSTFTESSPTEGRHVYCISAIYNDGCESEQMCTEVTTEEPLSTNLPVNNLQVTSDNGSKSVTLTWEKPFQGDWIGYCSETISSWNTIGSSGTPDFDIAIRYSSDETKKMYGYKLTQVRFLPSVAYSNCQYSIRVWVGGTPANPGTLVVDQPVSSHTVNKWNTIDLTNPVNVDPYEELWIGVRCKTMTAGSYPAASDPNTYDAGKGNMIRWSGSTWTTLSDLMVGANRNWFIRGKFEDMNPSSQLRAATTGYKIYRNNSSAPIATILDLNTTTYTDGPGLSNGDYTYGVSVVYAGGAESKHATVEVKLQSPTAIDDISQNNEIVIYPNPLKSGNILSVDLGAEYKDASIVIYNPVGAKVYEVQPTGQVTNIDRGFASGIYLLQIHVDGQTIVRKLIVK